MALLNLTTHSGVVSGRCRISRLIPLFFQTLCDCKTEVFYTGNVVHKASLIKGFQNSGILANLTENEGSLYDILSAIPCPLHCFPIFECVHSPWFLPPWQFSTNILAYQQGSVKDSESQVPIGSQCKQAQERKHSGNDEFHYLFTPLSYLYHWKSYAWPSLVTVSL